jgi:hypothetical protein
MASAASSFEGPVMAWTVFTTTFLWTPTMRGFFRPDVSSWAVMEMQGSGRSGSFWVFPLLAALALLLFYLGGRQRMRGVFHALLLAWQGALTGIVLYGIAREGLSAEFEGAMWSVRIPLWVIAAPFLAFFALAVRFVISERREPPPSPAPWNDIHWKSLAAAVLLLPVAVVFFRLGEGIDGPTRIATAATILQWIVLTQALSHRTRS